MKWVCGEQIHSRPVFSMFVFQNRFREDFSPAFVYSVNNRLIEPSHRIFDTRSSKFHKSSLKKKIWQDFNLDTFEKSCLNSNFRKRKKNDRELFSRNFLTKLLLTIIREIIYSSFARKVNKFVSFLNLFKKNYDINITSWNNQSLYYHRYKQHEMIIQFFKRISI